MIRALAVGLALLALLASGPAHAQLLPPTSEAPPEPIEGNVTWTTPHDFDHPYVVKENATLTIDGTWIHIENTTFVVEKNARVVVISRENATGELRSGLGGWMRVLGELDLVGRADRPVVVEGLGGTGTTANLLQGGATSLRNGLSIATGKLEASHVEFLNYTSGVLIGGVLGQPSHANLTDVVFDSPYGAGLITSLSTVHLENAAFRGRGGNAFFSISEYPSSIANVSFANSTTGLAFRDVTATARNVSVDKTEACVIIEAGGWTNLTLDGLECSGFRTRGVQVIVPQGTVKDQGRLALRRVLVTTTERALSGMTIAGNETLELADIDVGPTPQGVDGIVLTERDDALDNVTFHGVGGFAVTMLSPPHDPPARVPGKGAPGALGWLRVVQPTTIQVRTADHTQLLQNVTLEVTAVGSSTPAYSASNVTAPTIQLRRMTIDANGTVTMPTYDIRAAHKLGIGEKKDYAPKSLGVFVDLDGPAAPGTDAGAIRALPMGTGVVAIAIVVACLLARRRA